MKKKKKEDPPLNEKQLAFCREYIIDFNQTQSAIRAGYSKRSAGATSSRLLTNDNIQAEISRLNQERAERTGVTADRIVKQLEKIAFMDIKSVVDWGTEERKQLNRIEKDEDGEEVKHYRTEYIDFVRPLNAEDVDGTLIQSVKLGKYGFEVQIPDRMKAFEMLAKHTGVYDDRPQVAVSIESYKNALWERANAGDVWEGFDNGGPDVEDNDNGDDKD